MNPKEGADRGRNKEEKYQILHLHHPPLHHLPLLPLLAQVLSLNRTINIGQNKPKEFIKTTKSRNPQPNNPPCLQRPYYIKILKTNRH